VRVENESTKSGARNLIDSAAHARRELPKLQLSSNTTSSTAMAKRKSKADPEELPDAPSKSKSKPQDDDDDSGSDDVLLSSYSHHAPAHKKP
jgi:hypothetical protein